MRETGFGTAAADATVACGILIGLVWVVSLFLQEEQAERLKLGDCWPPSSSCGQRCCCYGWPEPHR